MAAGRDATRQPACNRGAEVRLPLYSCGRRTAMRIVVINHVTLDGVMQGPGRPDEDTRDGFAHGGWGIQYGDEATVAKMGERMGGDRAFLFGPRSRTSRRARAPIS